MIPENMNPRNMFNPHKETKITNVKIKCKNCGWKGRVGLCDYDADLPDVEDDGRLRCPICAQVVVEEKP